MSDRNLSLGDRVRFRLAKDIEAIIIGVVIYPGKNEYEVAWIHSGDRKTSWVKYCEIERLENTDA